MMDRTHFTEEFRRAMRFVIQKHDRVAALEQDIKERGSREFRELALAEAQTNLDAAIDQLGDHVFDGIQLSLEP